jgi:Ner family transcriptional regulator
MAKSEHVWDAHAIKAEVWRQGTTLTAIALKAGLYKSACRQGLMGTSRAGAEAIAAALNIPFRTLFPNSYNSGRHNEGKTSSNERCAKAQKTSGNPDTTTRAA